LCRGVALVAGLARRGAARGGVARVKGQIEVPPAAAAPRAGERQPCAARVGDDGQALRGRAHQYICVKVGQVPEVAVQRGLQALGLAWALQPPKQQPSEGRDRARTEAGKGGWTGSGQAQQRLRNMSFASPAQQDLNSIHAAKRACSRCLQRGGCRGAPGNPVPYRGRCSSQRRDHQSCTCAME
jgi:hypothetical protein